MTSADPLTLTGASLGFGERTLWAELDLAVRAGQFVTVLGPNGSGKSSLLKVVLGMQRLTRGSVRVAGHPARRGDPEIGYVPQLRGFAPDVPMRGADLVRLGLDGHRWGPPALRRSHRVQELLQQVEAEHLGAVPLGRMSGGEQQRIRVAQALATDPSLLLCDEPLLSLDLRHQQRVVELIDRRRREHGTAVMFVTHEINPVLEVTDQVLYLLDGRFVLGSPDDVLRSDVLSALYGAPVEVVRRRGRLAVLGAELAEPSAHDRVAG